MTYLIRGKVALFIKVVVVTLIASILLLLAQSAFAQREYVISGFLAISVLLLALTYLSKISIPLKFFIPGILLLTAFVIGPILYTVTMSGFNYKTGNIISKEEAIVQIKVRAIESAPSGLSFDIKLGRYDGEPAILASDINTPEYFISTKDDRIPLVASSLTLNEYGVAVEAPNFTPLNDSEFANADKEFTGTRFAFDDQYFIALEGFEAGVVSQEVLEFLPETDQFKNLLTGAIYTDNGRGNYALADDKSAILEPGWRAPIWFENYVNIVSDPRVREPLIRVFIWTVAFAFLTVLFARVAVILVNLWLGFPYFYLISSGSLQAIPSELLEAAAIDGANPRQIFRKITLPLLLQILSPLLIASFAFNFNNFNLIFLLTGGGPRNELDGEIAGATDILISYTYKIAFGSGTQDLGLASAISLIIFILVASISLYSLRKSKVLETFA